jgi:pimeloyl-ACP methyl ester carboxylesterase
VGAAMRAMGIGPSIVVGHSMGAFVATALAAQEPSLVSGLVLIDGGLVPSTPTGDSSGQGVAAAANYPATSNLSFAPGLSGILADSATFPSGRMESMGGGFSGL